MSPRKSRLETAFLWAWALIFCLGVLAGVTQFGVETFDVPLSRDSKRMLWNFIGAPLALTVFALPLYAATTASGFFEGQNVRWKKSGSCLGCWFGLVAPAVIISIVGVWADELFPSLVIIGFGWLWRGLLALCFLPVLIAQMIELWQAASRQLQSLRNWMRR